MKKLVLALLFVTALAGCQQTKNSTCAPMAGVPCASHMPTGGKVTAPVQVDEFCAKNPEFEKCLTK